MAVAATTPRSTTLTGSESWARRVDLPRRITQVAASVVILLVFLLLGFIAWNGTQIFFHSGVALDNIFSTVWAPSESPAQFGIFPFIAGTLGVMAVAAIISTPLSVGLAIFMSEIAPSWAKNVAQPAMEVFVGIPSVVW